MGDIDHVLHILSPETVWENLGKTDEKNRTWDVIRIALLTIACPVLGFYAYTFTAIWISDLGNETTEKTALLGKEKLSDAVQQEEKPTLFQAREDFQKKQKEFRQQGMVNPKKASGDPVRKPVDPRVEAYFLQRARIGGGCV